MNHKKESAGVFIWRLLYPVLIFLGVEMAIEMIVMYAYMFHEISEGNITPEEINSWLKLLRILYREAAYILQSQGAQS